LDVPREIAKAVEAERDKAEKRIRRVKDEILPLQMELQREKVLSTTSRRAAEERERRAEQRITDLSKSVWNYNELWNHAHICRQLAHEVSEKEGTIETLRERTKLLKMYQNKVSLPVHFRVCLICFYR
jgi:predicted RNase H-like nuclease (RuvC/YqgF family)